MGAPNSPQIGWADLPAAPQEQNAPIPTSPPLSSLPPSPNGERPTPVPAPRLSKPALPNKPEGLARNASRDRQQWVGRRQRGKRKHRSLTLFLFWRYTLHQASSLACEVPLVLNPSPTL